MEKYIEDGQAISDLYKFSEEDRPIMLPRAPKQTYIDVFPNADDPENDFRDEKTRQSNYETEVTMYRALEKLNENIIVLHGFEYSHHQYRVLDRDHVRKGCLDCKKTPKKKEGECDFLVIGRGYVVIIEVKDMTDVGHVTACEEDFHLCIIGENTQNPGCDQKKQSQALIATFTKSLVQRKKIVDFIKFLEKDASIFQYTVYPNFSKKFRKEFQVEQDQLPTIIFKEDLNNFEIWWKDFLTSSSLSDKEGSYDHSYSEKTKNVLLAIWCTDTNGECDYSKCSIGKCIKTIDKELRQGIISFRTKRRSANPAVLDAPDVMKRYIGINYLNKKQYEAFHSKEKLMWINGPAGAGKTIIFIGKIIQHVLLNQNNKVILLVFGRRPDFGALNSGRYQRAFNNAGIKHDEIFYQKLSYRDLHKAASKLFKDNQVVILHLFDPGPEYLADFFLACLKKTLSVSSWTIFVDDFQCNLLLAVKEPLMRLLSVLTISTGLDLLSVWIACDLAQCFYIHCTIPQLASFLFEFLSPREMLSLCYNLRNSSEISQFLSVVRNRFSEFYGLHLNGPDTDHHVSIMVPKHIPGHLIHGPRTVVHVVQSYNVDLVCNILNKELAKLHHNNFLSNSDIAVIYNSGLDDLPQIKKAVNSKCVGCFSSASCLSAEWPAVILVYNVTDPSGEQGHISSLYLSVSRARVYCAVIAYPIGFDSDFVNLPTLIKRDLSLELGRELVESELNNWEREFQCESEYITYLSEYFNRYKDVAQIIRY